MSNTTKPTTLLTGQAADKGNQSRLWNSVRQSPAIVAMIPFVLPQVLFVGGRTTQRMGQGLLAQVAFASASTDYIVTHNLGHPVNVVIPCMAPAGTFIPQVMVSATSNSAPNKQVILQANGVANPTTVVLF
jgi:hypothetical protein